jgi:copper homeostasis protein CutC
MPTSLLLEVCVTSAEQAAAAEAAGADRLELCTDLAVGGVTPTRDVFLRALCVGLPICVLVRPRAGNFVYTPAEFHEFRRDADWFLSHGAAAVVVGALTTTGELDRGRCAEVVRAAEGRAVLHRCFDELADLHAGLDTAIDLGFARVLTSGGAATATAGADVLRALARRAAGRIAVLPGGGIGPGNVSELVRATGCNQVHGSFRSADPATVAAVRAELDRIAVSP